MGFAEDWAAAQQGNSPAVGTTGYFGAGVSADGSVNPSFGYLPYVIGGGSNSAPVYHSPTPGANPLAFGGVGSTPSAMPSTPTPTTAPQAAPGAPGMPTMFPGGSPTFNETGGGGAWADQQQRLQMHGAPIPTDGGTGGGMAWPNASPWTQAQGQAVVQQTTDALTRGMLPAIQRGAALSSGYGGSRQSIGEGLAVGEATKGLAGQLANLYGTQFNADRNYGLQSDALDFNIFQGNNQIQRQGQLDQLGALGQFLNWGQAYGIGNANQVQQTPIDYWKTFTNGASQIAGQGGSTSTPYYGNPLMGAIGGWQMGNAIFGG